MKLTLTPMDINNKDFKRVMRGYNAEEVDDFLDEVIENYESLYKENGSLKEKVVSSSEKIEHYSKIEKTIQNTLLLAQNAADQAKASSQQEADMLIKNANETAQKILDKAHSDVVQINEEYENIKQEFIKFKAKFRNFINTQLDTFNDLEKNISKDFINSTPKQEIKDDIKTEDKRDESSELKPEEDEFFFNVNSEETIGKESEEKKIDIESEIEINMEQTEGQDTIVFDEESIKNIEQATSQDDDIKEIRSFFASRED